MIVGDTRIEFRNRRGLDEFPGNVGEYDETVGDGNNAADRREVAAHKRIASTPPFHRAKLRLHFRFATLLFCGTTSPFLRLIAASCRFDLWPALAQVLEGSVGNMPDLQVTVPARERNLA